MGYIAYILIIYSWFAGWTFRLLTNRASRLKITFNMMFRIRCFLLCLIWPLTLILYFIDFMSNF